MFLLFFVVVFLGGGGGGGETGVLYLHLCACDPMSVCLCVHVCVYMCRILHVSHCFLSICLLTYFMPLVFIQVSFFMLCMFFFH